MNEALAKKLFQITLGAAAIALLIGLVGTLVGYGKIEGSREGNNLVPLAVFGGAALLVVSLGLAASHSFLALSWIARIAVLALAGACLFQSLLFFRHNRALILLRADLAQGSESQFVDQIIRYRAGEPQYTPAADANSTPYTPGAPMVTYWIAKAVGRPDSVRTYRVTQLLYLAVAIAFCASAAWMLYRHVRPDTSRVWVLFWLPFLFLMATNQKTNVYSYVLYSDALAQAANCLAIWALIRYAVTQDPRWLWLMALVPGLGFLAKQKEALWAGLYVIYLLLEGRLEFRKVVMFAAAALVSVALAVGLCVALWGEPFWFWNMQVLARLKVPLTGSLIQLAGASPYLVPGAVGFLFLLARRQHLQIVIPLGAMWLVEVLVAMYTSGPTFRPAHYGPATMVGCVMFLAGLAAHWPSFVAGERQEDRADRSLTGWTTIFATLALIFYSFGVHGVNFVPSAVPPQMERYLRDIEREFEGTKPGTVLIDSGSWLYLPGNVVMKDRESPLGVLGGTGAYNLSATAERIRARHYEKLLLHKRMYFFWTNTLSDPIREHYEEVRTIPSPGVPSTGWFYGPLLSDIGVYVPKGSAPGTNPSSN